MPFPSTQEFHASRGCVAWQGISAANNQSLTGFLQGPVRARLDDTEGRDGFIRLLNGLALTGMGQASLRDVLGAEVPEDRDWAAGEALAEAYLEEHHGVTLPWNTERDKRNPYGSLPGADIVGLQADGNTYRLVLGEVKCSSEVRSPPQVMTGRSGMAHQLEELATNLGVICQLLQWLFHRVKQTENEIAFQGACSKYFNSGNREVSLFGVLIRDQLPRVTDLQSRGERLAEILQSPTHCELIGLFLPWPIERLPSEIRGGGAV